MIFMSGIGYSTELVQKGKNVGVVKNIRRCIQTEKLSGKSLRECHNIPEEFKLDFMDEVCIVETGPVETWMEVELDNGEIITAVDYGSDNIITPFVGKGNRVALGLTGGYSAEWISLDSVRLGYDPDKLKACRKSGEVGI